MRLIDADKIVEQINEWLDQTGAIPLNTSYHFELLGCIEDCPTIDAVPVVRCGECRFRNTSWYDKRDMFESFCRWDRDESPNDDDYCSFGEKMEVEP